MRGIREVLQRPLHEAVQQRLVAAVHLSDTTPPPHPTPHPPQQAGRRTIHVVRAESLQCSSLGAEWHTRLTLAYAFSSSMAKVSLGSWLLEKCTRPDWRQGMRSSMCTYLNTPP